MLASEPRNEDRATAERPPSRSSRTPAVPVVSGLRADAERNRERILSAAQELFTQRGLETPLEDIALQAGVGIATLYRRFPTRGDLVAAAFEQRISEYSDVVERGLADPDAWHGFCNVIIDLCAIQAADAGLKELLTMRFPEASGIDDLKTEALRNMETLIARARKQGALRADFDTADVTMLLLANAGLITATQRTAPDAWRRFVTYMIQAFHTGQADTLPAPATFEQLEQPLGDATGH